MSIVLHAANDAGVMAAEDRHGLMWDQQITIDLPRIDFSLLLENICDPDHGVFAHQVGSIVPPRHRRWYLFVSFGFSLVHAFARERSRQF